MAYYSLMDLLNREIDKSRPIPLKRFPIRVLSISKRSIQQSMMDIRQNRDSKTEGPIEVMYNIDTHQFIVTDGYHRLVNYISKKEQFIPVKIWSTTYSDYHADIRPDDLFFKPEGIDCFPSLRKIEDYPPMNEANQLNILDNPNFKKWFNGSKVVDKDGNPLRMYHGTGSDFTKFEHDKTGGVGFYFTSDPEEANVYADFRRGENENVMPVYLSIKNPATTEIEESIAKEFQGRLGGNPRLQINKILQQRGYDGIVRDTHVIAFYPNQIKSAIGNTGDFNTDDPNIIKEIVKGTIKVKPIKIKTKIDIERKGYYSMYSYQKIFVPANSIGIIKNTGYRFGKESIVDFSDIGTISLTPDEFEIILDNPNIIKDIVTEEHKRPGGKKARSFVAVFRYKPSLEVLLVKDRKGRWTMPGGQADTKETYNETAWRELEEETNIVPDFIKHWDKIEDEDKITHAYYGEVTDKQKAKSGTDAKGVKWSLVDKIDDVKDLKDFHKNIIKDISKEIYDVKKEIKEAMRHASKLNIPLSTFTNLLLERKRTIDGYLIVMEGIDGAGKSTQCDNLKNWLEDKGWKVTVSKWSNSPAISDAIKAGKKGRWLSPTLFCLLNASDMIWRYENIIKPALDKGHVVICDRFYYTSYVRDILRGVRKELLDEIYKNFPEPDLILHFIVPPDVAVARLLKDKGFKWYSAGRDIGYSENEEQSALKYEKEMDKLYKSILPKIKNYKAIKTTRTIDEIFKEIKEFVREKIQSVKKTKFKKMINESVDESFSEEDERRYWIEPNGKVHDVSDVGHKKWGEEYLEKLGIVSTDSPPPFQFSYIKLYSMNWTRVVVSSIGYPTSSLGFTYGIYPNNIVLNAIKDIAKKLNIETITDDIKKKDILLNESMFPKTFNRHCVGICMDAVYHATKHLLSKNRDDFKIVEGTIEGHPEIVHMWIEFNDGRIFDPSKKQFNKMGIKNIKYLKKPRIEYTPEEVIRWDTNDIAFVNESVFSIKKTYSPDARFGLGDVAANGGVDFKEFSRDTFGDQIHGRMGNPRGYNTFRYASGIIDWSNGHPSNELKDIVNSYLEKRGFPVEKHVSYYDIFGKPDDDIDESIQKLDERLSFADLYDDTDDERIFKSKLPGMHVRPMAISMENGNETWNFGYTSQEKSQYQRHGGKVGHKGRIIFFKDSVEPEDNAEDLECMVDCDCKDFQFRFAYVDAQQDASVIGPNSLNKATNSLPIKTNPEGETKLCKHLAALVRYLVTNIDRARERAHLRRKPVNIFETMDEISGRRNDKTVYYDKDDSLNEVVNKIGYDPEHNHPDLPMNWDAIDIPSNQKWDRHSIRKFVGLPNSFISIYPSILDVNELDAHTDNDLIDSNEYHEFGMVKKGFPPIIVRRDLNGKLYLVDGNHRVYWAQRNDYRTIGAWVIDEIMQRDIMRGELGKISETRIITPEESLYDGYITLYHGTIWPLALKAKKGELGPQNMEKLIVDVLVNVYHETPQDAKEYYEKYSKSRKEDPNVIFFTTDKSEAEDYARVSTKYGGELFYDVLGNYLWDKNKGINNNNAFEKLQTNEPAIITVNVPLSMVLTHPLWSTPFRSKIRQIMKNIKNNPEIKGSLSDNFNFEVFVKENIPARFVQRIDRVSPQFQK